MFGPLFRGGIRSRVRLLPPPATSIGGHILRFHGRDSAVSISQGLPAASLSTALSRSSSSSSSSSFSATFRRVPVSGAARCAASVIPTGRRWLGSSIPADDDDGDVDPISRIDSLAGDEGSMYEKKTPVEHVLIRPDTYIGPVDRGTAPMRVLGEDGRIVRREASFVPGLYKIFDEVLVNAADNFRRDPTGTTRIEVEIDPAEGRITIGNDGRCIPVVVHGTEKVYVPEMVLGQLLTGSNFRDDAAEKRVTGGRNGYGAKLANIFSREFAVDIVDARRGLRYRQTWTHNMGEVSEPVIEKVERGAGLKSFTRVSFVPDLARFGMETLDEETIALLRKRVYDLAGCAEGVAVHLDGQRVPVSSFAEYASLYEEISAPPDHADGGIGGAGDKKREDDDDGDGTVGGGGGGGGGDGELASPASLSSSPPHVAIERINDRWTIAVAVQGGARPTFSHASFVNSICTLKGGTHVTHVADQIARAAAEAANKRDKTLNVLPRDVRSRMMLFINCLIENPAFDSQTKDTLTTKVSNFGSTCSIRPASMQRIIHDTGLVDAIVEDSLVRQRSDLLRSTANRARSRITGVAKLDDANWAGTSKSGECTLIITEGDSAKALAVAGLAVVGRDAYGVYPLRGKMLNVRDAPVRQIVENAEVSALVKIIGLQHDVAYDTEESLATLRYRRVIVMCDQDHDGSHIKGLFINFIQHFWPALMRADPPFLAEFVTPIVKATKGKTAKSFYTLRDFEDWQNGLVGALKDGTGTTRPSATPTAPPMASLGWTAKYYKGLGTNTAAEGRDYFRDLAKHRITFRMSEQGDDEEHIDMAFNKKRAADRKVWLGGTSPAGAEPGDLEGDAAGGNGPAAVEVAPPTTVFADSLETVDHTVPELSYRDFINKELIWFSMADNLRSIPSAIDGLKPGQRKILYASFKRNLRADIKVAQLAGYVAEHTAYHHGEASLHGTIVNMAQRHVGSNNLSLLEPIGQFGTRAQGGKDSASARYIFTKLSDVARHIFPADDDAILDHLTENGDVIEPRHYLPVIPMVLVNGAEGIGTGWSTSVPCHHPIDVINAVRHELLKCERQSVNDGNDADASGDETIQEGACDSDASPDSAGNGGSSSGAVTLVPWYRGFTGEITPAAGGNFVTRGSVSLSRDRTAVDITELPVGTWTQSFKEQLESRIGGSASGGKGRANIRLGIKGYREHHTYTTVRFSVTLSKATARMLSMLSEEEAVDRVVRDLKLTSTLQMGNMHLFTGSGSIKRYGSAMDVVRDFVPARLGGYDRRRRHLLAAMEAKRVRAESRSAFVNAVVAGEIEISRRPQAEIAADLRSRFPAIDGGHDYLMMMPIAQLTADKVAALEKETKSLREAERRLRKSTAADLWRADLDRLEKAVDKHLSRLEAADAELAESSGL